ncbi:MAG TPA: hypothetical protein DCX17_03035 [Firmicutes bacterium]|nr:hypothetical protein [Bacillota bacterium]
MTIDQALLILFVFLGVIAILVLSIIGLSIYHHGESNRQKRARDLFYARYYDGVPTKLPLFIRHFFDAFLDIETQIKLDPSIRSRVIADLIHRPFTRKQLRYLNHPSRSIRKVAISYVAALKTEKSINKLRATLYIEPDPAVRFLLVYALIDELNSRDIAFILATLESSGPQFINWIATLFKNRYYKIKPLLLPYFDDSRPEVIDLLLNIATYVYDPRLGEYCFNLLEKEEYRHLDQTALEALVLQHPVMLRDVKYLHHQNPLVRKFALRATSSKVDEEMVTFLIDELGSDEFDNERINSLSHIIFDDKSLLLKILTLYPSVKRSAQQKGIAKVLSHHIDYLIVRMRQDEFQYIGTIIDQMLEMHIVEDLIDFMNQNSDERIIARLMPHLKKHASNDPYVLDQLSIYLHEDILRQLGLLKKPSPQSTREKAPVDRGKRRWIIRWIIVSILFLPLLTLAVGINEMLASSLPVTTYIITMNQAVVVYFMTANGIYLVLLLISLWGARTSDRLWHIKKAPLLFEHDLLPRISIIAPAYNEQLSIVESVTSLLNLKYPQYEVIVVNDGSKDHTIDVLIKHFQLERKHPFFMMPLATKPLRGVYVNPKIPNLIVIDKENGGKADALNMGINAAKGGYVCGIDADSLLEEKALLKLMSVTLDNSEPHIALGGNIVPVNGSIVDRGKIEKSGLGKQPLVRFQTLEYLRAFTSGRIGWSSLKSLLIISGAFGIFKRDDLISTGGYLTMMGRFKKDTVGEDMELVVRLTYQALQDKKPYRVKYVHYASCYTELPADLKSLLKQRNRWQRGLLDILSYHRRILLNPRYKQPAMIGFPYFFVFEMMGPFIETIGYLALLVGLILGILNVPLVILLFTVTVAFGLVISLFSLFIAERKNTFYSIKEMFILILFCCLENFGFRQLMSVHRIKGTFASLKETGSWGAQNRQGFQKTTTK